MGAFADAGVNFHLRSAAVFLHADHVLLHRAVGDTIWALPGGHVEPWEDTAATLVRECREEIGAEITVGQLLWVGENYWTDRSGRNHEVGFYYRAELHDPALCDTSRGFMGREDLWIPGQSLQLEFRWIPLRDVPGMEAARKPEEIENPEIGRWQGAAGSATHRRHPLRLVDGPKIRYNDDKLYIIWLVRAT